MKKIILTVVMVLCFSVPAFANVKDRAELVSTLRQAAEELKQSNPQLSKKLSDFAAKKEEWKEKSKEKWKEKKGEMKKFHKQKMKDAEKLKEAATALEATHQDLAKDLRDIAKRWEKKAKKI